MKKNMILWGVAAFLILSAIYVTNRYSLKEKMETVHTESVTASETVSSSSLPSASPARPAIAAKPELDGAEDFKLVDLEGKEVSLTDLRGKYVYLNFWATWCKWCKKEMPDLKEVYDNHQTDDIVFLTVNVGEDQSSAWKYMNDNGYPFRVLLDSDKSVTRAYGIRSIPVSLFIDKEGKISHKRTGAMNKEEMEIAIQEMLNRS
ncbi:TlpA family protein disulfide reductase [Cohnella endophytica]|uniref:TlpA family protein disulfide reductase n=1 Tax=Cohnella endophytica TaxID=2419778 RepID=A0A494XMT3_9BACL|nr:TlpA disulfide reductase family protein [Cohnella endophytica]RKP50006.1 TlpA family protein disulfide reductase [Cohnella endophytica]